MGQVRQMDQVSLMIITQVMRHLDWAGRAQCLQLSGRCCFWQGSAVCSARKERLQGYPRNKAYSRWPKAEQVKRLHGAMTLLSGVALLWASLCINVKHYSICSHTFSSRNRIVLLDFFLSFKSQNECSQFFYLTLNRQGFFHTPLKKRGGVHWPLAVVCHNSSRSQTASHSQVSLALKNYPTH